MRSRSAFSLSLTLLAAAVSLAPTTAKADAPCSAPLLVQCRDPAYLSSSCGQASTSTETSACTALLRTAYQAELQKPDIDVIQVMPPEQPGTAVVAAAKRYSFSAHVARAQDFPGSYLGIEQRATLANVSGGNINFFSDGLTVLGLSTLKEQRRGWEVNGNAVGSCSEFANERYAEYAKWKDLADVSLLSDEVLFHEAFDQTHGIANRTLYNRSRTKALAPIAWPSNGSSGTVFVSGVPTTINDPKAPKNGYFKAYRSLARGSFFGPNDAALRSKLFAGFSHHVNGWSWHQQQQHALGSLYDAETLRYFEDKQVDFLQTVDARERLLGLIAKFGPTLVTTDPPTNRNLAAELSALEVILRAALSDAEADGCLDPVNSTKCDWSYRQLRDQVVGFYAKQMEASFQQCIAATAGDFASSAPIHNAVAAFGAFAKGRQDYASSAEGIEDYQGVVTTWVAAQSFPKKPDGTPSLGDQKHDAGSLGSSTFSLDWAYDTSWAVTDLTKTSQACAANLSVDGGFTAKAHAFGTTVPILDAKSKVYTQGSLGKAQILLSVGSEVVWNRWDSPYTTELQAGLVKEVQSGASKSYSTTVYPFGIPVTLSGGVGMSVGLKLDAKAKIGGTCQSSPAGAAIELASIQGSVTPWAQADAFGSAAIGIPGFQAGLKVDVVIVRGEMPMTANAKIRMNSARAINASVTLSGKQKFRMLDGSVKAFIDGPFDFMDTETTLFAWQGPSIDKEVFRLEKLDMPLALMQPSL